MTLARNQRHEPPRPHDHQEPDQQVVAPAADGPGPPLCPGRGRAGRAVHDRRRHGGAAGAGVVRRRRRLPRHTHFVHDAGAFQLGIGLTLVLAVAWRDGLALALAGFLVANTTHAVNHAVDLDLGGHSSDPWGLAALSLLTAAALVVRLGQLGWVVGDVGSAASPVLARFVRQKTVLVTTYRQDGRPVGTPVSLAIDGDHAYLRSFEQAGKTRRLHHNPRVDIAPSTARGRPTGPAIQATARRLEDVEAQRAARLLGRQAPVATRPAGAVEPSPGSRQGRQDRPLPADPPPPWPGEVTAHGHPDEPSRHIHGRRACTQESPWKCSHRWRRYSEHRP